MVQFLLTGVQHSKENRSMFFFSATQFGCSATYLGVSNYNMIIL